MNDLIEKLSNLRSQFNCFNENERDAYHTLSEAIKAISERPELREDDKHCSNCIYSGRPIYKSPCSECHNNSQWEIKPISRSHENGIECEDAVSRRILLNDLKELIAAWEKYPIMAEQIKGVETAIEYVETIPSVTPKRKTGKWICIDCTDIEGNGVNAWKCSECGKIYVDVTNFCSNCGADMRGKQDDD